MVKRADKKLFEPIISPVKDMDRVRGRVSQVKCDLVKIMDRYLPWLSTIPLEQGCVWAPTWKALPTEKIVTSVLVNRKKMAYEKVKAIKSSFLAFPYELASWTFLVRNIHAMGEQWSPGILWPVYTRYPRGKLNKTISGLCLDYFEKYIGPVLPTVDQMGIPPYTGRLGQSLEGGGKRRLFAIGNYVNQRLLAPVYQNKKKRLAFSFCFKRQAVDHHVCAVSRPGISR